MFYCDFYLPFMHKLDLCYKIEGNDYFEKQFEKIDCTCSILILEYENSLKNPVLFKAFLNIHFTAALLENCLSSKYFFSSSNK